MEVIAKLIDREGYFRKKTGRTVYKRISVWSVRHYKMDPKKVYGVSYNGHMTDVDLETTVVLMSKASFLECALPEIEPEERDPDDWAPDDYYPRPRMPRGLKLD